MTTTTDPMTRAQATVSPATYPPRARGRTDEVRAFPAALRSEWIKLSTVRANKLILTLNVVVAAFASWAVATLVTDEVLTVSEVFVYPTMLTAVFAAVAGIMLFSSEAQHGTLAGTLAVQPARWLTAVSKTITAATFGVTVGVTGMVAGAGGSAAGGLEAGDTSTMAATALWALVFCVLAAVIGLGVGMVVRHGTAAISGLLVWWLVAENLILTFAPAKMARFLPFDAGYRLLGIGSDFDSPALIAAALTRPQYALIFGGYAALAVTLGTVLLYRRDTN